MRIAAGLALDTVLVVLFAAIGRRNHAETGALTAILTTAWPFLAGMATGWLISLFIVRRIPLQVRDGVTVATAAVALGMLLRGATGEGTAFSFIIVAALFLGAAMLGWRWAWTLTARQRA
ncbi:MAG: DUF3054 domain-containing protein [Actinomycetota bacterium]